MAIAMPACKWISWQSPPVALTPENALSHAHFVPLWCSFLALATAAGIVRERYPIIALAISGCCGSIPGSIQTCSERQIEFSSVGMVRMVARDSRALEIELELKGRNKDE